jgi:hypothetical protein
MEVQAEVGAAGEMMVGDEKVGFDAMERDWEVAVLYDFEFVIPYLMLF